MNRHVETPVPLDQLERIESVAVELANLAGAEIVSALGGIFTVRYKTGATESALWRAGLLKRREISGSRFRWLCVLKERTLKKGSA